MQYINNSLSLESLNKALRLGNLGIQIVLISEKAFKCIKYISSNQIDSKIYNKKKINITKIYLFLIVLTFFCI